MARVVLGNARLAKPDDAPRMMVTRPLKVGEPPKLGAPTAKSSTPSPLKSPSRDITVPKDELA